MDAPQYDRIADILTQIHMKIANLTVIRSANCKHWRETMLYHLQEALKANDELGHYASKGWIE